jgi:ketosteroid isomerase-like protein
MPEESVEIVRGLYAHFAATRTVNPERLSPDVIWDMSNFDSWPERRVYEGRAGVDEFIRAWLEPWDEYEMELENLLGTKTEVVAILRVVATAKLSGASVEMRVAHVWTLADGLAVRTTLYSDPEKALEAVGISE